MNFVAEAAIPYLASPATTSDVTELVRLMEEFHAESGYVLDRQWAGRSFVTLLRDQSLGKVWLVRCGELVVGHVVLTVRFSMEYGGTDAFIDDLFVRPEHRRRGAASAALSAVLAECRERKVLALHVEVGQDNVAANALYTRFGLLLGSDRRQTRTIDFGGQEPFFREQSGGRSQQAPGKAMDKR